MCVLGLEARACLFIHISEPTRRTPISYAVFCLKKKKKTYQMTIKHPIIKTTTQLTITSRSLLYSNTIHITYI